MARFHFSYEVKDIIAESRLIAIETGYSYISTIHLFFADCRLNRPGSLRDLFFTEGHTLETAILESRNPELDLDHLSATLPLTKEAEDCIVNAENERIRYQQSITKPAHLFLAAAANPSSLFYTGTIFKEKLYQELVSYYQQKGQLQPDLVAKSNIFSRISLLLKVKK